MENTDKARKQGTVSGKLSLIGKMKLRNVMKFWRHTHYTWHWTLHRKQKTYVEMERVW